MNTLKMTVAAVTFATLGSASIAQDVTIRYSEWLPPTYFMNERGLYPYFAEIETVTEGRVVVEVSSAPLGPPPRALRYYADPGGRGCTH